MKKLQNKLNHLSIKWKIFMYMAVFCIMMLTLLWLFQVVFLNSFYTMIKTNMVESVSNGVVDHINHADLQTYIDQIAQKKEVCIVISSGEEQLYRSKKGDPKCFLPVISEIGSLIDEAKNSEDKTAFQISEKKNKDRYPVHFEENGKPPRNEITKNMTHLKIVKGLDDQEYTIVVNAMITPVDATVDTIRTQLIIITIILLILAMILALFLSRKISKPIITISENAKAFGKGDYHVEFQGKGYLEIEELNDTLNYAAKELSKVEDLRRELIANMSHDLRTPLTMIAGYGEVMRDIPGENTPENIQIIIDETTRLTNLVNDILDLSKLQAGVQQLNLDAYPISDDIRNIIKRYEKLLKKQEYKIVFECDEDVVITADHLKMGQVIYNLINNALTYMGNDHMVIVRQIVYSDYVRIEIQDHGMGIAKEQLPYIWERYYKVDKTHIRSQVGTGLGLSIVKNILELHKAKYGADSEEGKGTCFWFELPRNLK